MESAGPVRVAKTCRERQGAQKRDIEGNGLGSNTTPPPPHIHALP